MPTRARSLATARLLVALTTLAVGAVATSCAERLAFEPVEATNVGELDPEVLELVRAKVAVARASPSDARAHGSLGLAYWSNGIWEAAERSLDRAARLEPSNAMWRYYRATALRETGASEASLALLAEVARELPGDPAVQQRYAAWLVESGDLEGARAALERALAKAPERAELLVALANVAIAREDWSTAADLARRALRADPEMRVARYSLGIALRGLGRAEESARELKIGMGARHRWLPDAYVPETASYRVNYVAQMADASELMLAGKHAQALPILERVAKKRPRDVGALSNLAACLQETGNPTRARELLLFALEVDEREVATHLNLVDACLRLQKLDEAAKHADRAVELVPDLGRAHLTRARVLATRGAFEDAYAALKTSHKLDANNAMTAFALAEVCAQLRREPEARAWCAKAVEMDPASVPARVNLAVLTLRAGEVADARRQVEELKRMAPENERVLALARELEKRP